MKLEEIRKDIDKVDSQIADLFKERMALSLDIAKAKQEGNLPVVNASREKEILHRISNEVGEPLDGYARILFNTLFDLSRSYQNNYLSRVSDIGERIEKALEETPKLFPKKSGCSLPGCRRLLLPGACEKTV